MGKESAKLTLLPRLNPGGFHGWGQLAGSLLSIITMTNLLIGLWAWFTRAPLMPRPGSHSMHLELRFTSMAAGLDREPFSLAVSELP